eukprot:292390_1
MHRIWCFFGCNLIILMLTRVIKCQNPTKSPSMQTFCLPESSTIFPTTDNKPPPPTINTIHMPGHYSNPMYNYPYPTYSPQTHPPWYYHMVLISYILMILHLDLKIIINHHHIHY